MEFTKNYHMVIAQTPHNAGFYVSVVNATLVHDYGNNSLRRTKTDKKHAVMLANYGLAHWTTLPNIFLRKCPIAIEKLLLTVPTIFQSSNYVEK